MEDVTYGWQVPKTNIRGTSHCTSWSLNFQYIRVNFDKWKSLTSKWVDHYVLFCWWSNVRIAPPKSSDKMIRMDLGRFPATTRIPVGSGGLGWPKDHERPPLLRSLVIKQTIRGWLSPHSQGTLHLDFLFCLKLTMLSTLNLWCLCRHKTHPHNN